MANTTIPADGWDIQRTAAFLGLKVKTLYNWAYLDKPPIPRRVGSRLVYAPEEVIAFRDGTCRRTRRQIVNGR
ncbi:hypothetical protein EP30_05315 [Bifidobacterium sp. UTCIF-39]|uniref:helix-turn-helix domain-containing protein n=1 Tax=Bifidobacterium sp. UTCIF-39 TaxID=1465359 RepID=UPI001128C7B6|nr:helix-turn-helix domain-containing protein [Bifidobacterium sp. UTCIF-39]TPF96839.1 hypothetical protein EP30_05315 [Bifidobacterium sp. UTCIF-39]